MTTAYTSLLGLALPVTGELSGTWGDTVNDYITKYLDASVAGTQTISGSQTAVTLSVTTNANLSQVGSGATGSAQYSIINCTGNPAGLLTVTVPAASKTYVVVNATSTNQQVKVVGAGPTTGVTLEAGEKAVIAWNGSDFIKIATSAVDGVSTISFGTTGLTPSSATSGAVTVAGTLVAANGGTGQSTYTTGDLLYATGSTALSKLGIGTNGQILTSTGTAPQWSTLSGVAVTTFSAGTTGFTPSVATSGAVTLAGTLATTNGGTGLTSFTANGVVYASSSSALTTGSALSFDGTNLTQTAGTPVFTVFESASGNNNRLILTQNSGLTTYNLTYSSPTTNGHVFQIGGAEQMRLNSSGLEVKQSQLIGYSSYAGIGTNGLAVAGNVGIGTSSPTSKLDIVGVTQWQASAGTVLGKLTYSGGEPVVLANTGLGLQFFTNNTFAAKIDSSGNLGLGVTPSAWGLGKAFEIGNAGNCIWGVQSNDLRVGANMRYDGSNYRYINNGFAARYDVNNGSLGGHAWFTAPSGTAGNAISFTQAMTLDASGNLLVGNTTDPLGSNRMLVQSAGTGDNNRTFSVYNTAATSTTAFANRIVQLSSNGSGADVTLHFSDQVANNAYIGMGSGALYFATNGTNERARITSGGDLLVGTSSGQVSATVVAYRASADTACVGPWNAATTGDNLFVVFNTEATATVRGSIDYNRAGGLTRYNTTSDYRAKDIIGPVANTGTTIDALKVYEGVMKGATQARPMMIAHEAQAVVPFCVSGEKDAVNADGTPKYQQMDHASLVPLLIAELQSLRARVAALETK